MKFVITQYSSVKDGVIANGGHEKYTFNNPDQSNLEFKEAYRALGISYPKFFKMDNLSKLGILCSELILANIELSGKYKPDEVAVVLQNSASTIDVDMKYQETISDKESYFPNPSLFVYTLPNIMIGEICIRNKFQGEGLLTVCKAFDPELLYQQVERLMERENTNAVLAGFVDYMDGVSSAFVFLAEKEGNVKEFLSICSVEKLVELYSK